MHGIELRRDIKAQWAGRYAESIARIQSHRITVNGCFVLGLDSHDPGIFAEVERFATETGLYDVQVTGA